MTTMAVFSQQFYFYLVLISISSLFLVMNLVFAGPTTAGLTLKLIHRDSPESPLYPGNLTQEERIQRDFQRSKARHQQLKASIKSWRRVGNNHNNSTNSYHPDIAKPPVYFSPETHFYMALVGIGTFLSSGRYINYYLLVDTASDLLWVQCQGCNPCYPQVGDSYYPARSSATYHPLPCNHHYLCEYGKCDGTFCSYEVLYGDGASSYGVLASETFRVNADNDFLESIDNIVFGCGSKQQNFHYYGEHVPQRETELGGMLGLAGGERSFLSQLGDRGQMKFAYCFQLWTHNRNSHTFLRFGYDAAANIGRGGQVVQTTPMFFGTGPKVYYVNLQDISIAGIRMGFTPEDFILKNTGTGGCVFDSGTQWTLLAPAIYDRLEDDLIRFFTSIEVYPTELRPVSGEYNTCFTKPNPWYTIYPTITFHFERADLEIQPEAAFYIGDDIFCFAILRDDEAEDDYDDDEAFDVIIGAIQQANYRILYDVGNMKISWAREDCSLNP